MRHVSQAVSLYDPLIAVLLNSYPCVALGEPARYLVEPNPHRHSVRPCWNSPIIITISERLGPDLGSRESVTILEYNSYLGLNAVR